MPRSVVLVMIAALASPLAQAQEPLRTVQRSYEVPERGALSLAVPEGWVEEVRQPSPNLPPTIVLRAKDPQSLELLITPIPTADGAPATANLQAARGELAEVMRSVLPTAVETEVRLDELRGAAVKGWFFQVNAKDPPPSEFPAMAQGSLATSDLLISFTILTRDLNGAETASALAVLPSLRQQVKIVQRYRVSLDDLRLSVLLARAAGFVVEEVVSRKDLYEVRIEDFRLKAEKVDEGLQITIEGDDPKLAEELLAALTRWFPDC